MMTRLSPVASAVAAATATLVMMQASAENYGEAEYIGCFHDNRGDRVLGDKRTSSDMTTKVRRASQYFCQRTEVTGRSSVSFGPIRLFAGGGMGQQS